MKQIICPDCGKVKEYGIVEQVRRTLYFDANDEPCDASEDVCIYFGKKKNMPDVWKKSKGYRCGGG